MPTALTIGNFDGVHAGHAALVARARSLAGPRGTGAVVALVFDPHPLSRLRPEAAPPRLTTFEQRERLLRGAGADAVERLNPDGGVLSLTPEQFARSLVDRFHPGAIVEGPDFHFGKGRSGTVETLAALGVSLGFTCDVVPPVDAVLTDHTVVRASSTMARWLIGHGRMSDAAAVLGRPYELEGEVVRGDRCGRQLGVPTANLQTDQLLPADGVYAGEATLPDGRVLPAAITVGTRPTVNPGPRRLEAHLPGAPRDADAIAGLPEYGWTLRVRVTRWLRDDLRFDSVEALRAQIARDVERSLVTA